jgi:hypothetical protein
MDGFRTVDVAALENGSTLNLEPYRNAYSPYSRVDLVPAATPSGEVLVDEYYGLAYDAWIRQGGAPYGITSEIPVGPLDALASGFLRVPFARVPRIHVNSRKSVLRAIDVLRQSYDGLRLLFRGQDREHMLGRDPATLEALYGEQVVEPSLLSSSERRGMNIDSVGPAWCGILRYVLDCWAVAQSDSASFNRVHRAGLDYRFHHFALAMAQHYGLPSSGLDVTDSSDVALFFALHTFAKHPTENAVATCSRVKAGTPVLYVFGTEIDMHYVKFETDLIGNIPDSRPARQSAFFLHRGWGLARNRSARSLLAALILDPGGQYGDLPEPSRLFPGPDEDLLGQAIANARRFLTDELPGLGRFLDYFAWVQYAVDADQ